MKEVLKKILPHAVAIVLFVTVTAVYFSPMLIDGKQLRQYDILQYNGSANEILEYRDRTGDEALWTNSMFGGMPAYHISVRYPNNWLLHLHKFLSLGMPSPAYMIFLAFLGFYVMLLCFRVNPWLSIAGALAYGLSTYFLIIAGAGHNTKMRAMAFMPVIIGGLYLAYRQKKMWMGVLLVCLALGLQIRANHLQITYYTAMVVLIFLILEFVRVNREKQYAYFIKTSAAMCIAVTLAIGANITNMLLTAEYTPYSTRGQSELTDESGDQTRGLDRSYILNNYSYGISETMDLFIPNFAGGPISANAARKSELFDVLVRQAGIPRNTAVDFARNMTYWGGQDGGTSGPVYLGAVVIFLFVLSLFALKGQLKWWLLASTLLAIALAWGKYFGFFSNLFIDYFPLYNKFRTVSMILVIPMVTVPLMGILAASEIMGNNLRVEEKTKALKNSFFIAGGVALFFALFPGLLFSFEGIRDAADYPEWILVPLYNTREWALRSDAFRSLIFVTAAATILWCMVKNKLKYTAVIAILTTLIVVDLWTVGKRYLNDSHFSAQGVNYAPQPTQTDREILRDQSLNYRVMNLAANTFNDATTSFFHKSIGGYHGAKMKRYQEMIERHIGRGNMDVLNMLNTKYFIIADRETGITSHQTNNEALGNAWTVSEIRWVDSADEEIEALFSFEPEREAVIDRRFYQMLDGFSAQHDSTATIELTAYQPNHLTYEFYSQSPQMIVFSEIFYSRGWNAYINGEPKPHIRANYILRAMVAPAGKHEIEFKFEPDNYVKGERIALISSISILLLAIGVFAKELIPFFYTPPHTG